MAYGFKATITIDDTKVSGTGDLTDFPVLISGTYDGTGSEPDLRVTGSGGNVTSSSGYDIIFTSDSGGTTQLDHEIETYVSTTGAVCFWVRVPTLAGSSSTVIYMWYGDAGVTTSQEDAAGVWDADYVGVYHLKETPDHTADEVKDSSGTNHGTGGGTLASVAGAFGGKAINFGGAGYVDLGARSDHNFSGNYTVSAWAYNASGSISNCAVVAHDQSTGRQWDIHVSGDTTFWADVAKSGGYVSAEVASGFANGAWKHLVGRYNGSNIEAFTNGSKTTGGAVTGAPDSHPTTHSSIGTFYTFGSYVWTGYIDEVRLSKIARSDDYLITEYNNGSSPSTFYAMGDETIVSGGGYAGSQKTILSLARASVKTVNDLALASVKTWNGLA